MSPDVGCIILTLWLDWSRAEPHMAEKRRRSLWVSIRLNYPSVFVWLVVKKTIWKNMSSSMGRMTSHIWNGKIIQMFQTTNQLFNHKLQVVCWLHSMDWFKGKSTGNHRFSHEIWGFPVIFPLNQSIDTYMYPILVSLFVDWPTQKKNVAKTPLKFLVPPWNHGWLPNICCFKSKVKWCLLV